MKKIIGIIIILCILLACIFIFQKYFHDMGNKKNEIPIIDNYEEDHVDTSENEKSENMTSDKNNSIGLTQKDWKWFIDTGEYKEIKLFNENFIAIQNKEGKYGFMNKEKNIIVDYQYFNVLGVTEGFARVLDFEKNYLFIDEKGETISNVTFSDALDFHEGLAAVKNSTKWGFINASGEVVIDYQFDSVLYGFSDGLAAVQIDEQWSFINKNGELIFSNNFDSVKKFQEGYAGVKKGSKWGFIDLTGSIIIDFKYDDVGNFSEEKAAVKNIIDGNEQWAYIDKNDEIVIDFRLYYPSEGRMLIVGEFKNGYALVTNALYCLIDETGEIVLGENDYFLTGGSAYNSQHGIVSAYTYADDMLTTKYGFVDIGGNPKILFEFDYISEICGDLVKVTYIEDEDVKVGVIKLK